MRRHHLLLLGILAPGTALTAPVYTITDLGSLGGTTSSASDINASGQVTEVSNASVGFSRAFLWDPVMGMRDLGTLGGGESLGYGINASGQVTGTIITAGNFAYRAFLWDGMSMLDLNDLIAPGSGWILEQGLAINDAG
jgi:probable HAF family extracellular repeat protein